MLPTAHRCLFAALILCVTFPGYAARKERPFSLSVIMGTSLNTISSTDDMHYFFSPTSKSEPNIGYSWALETDFKLADFFSLVTGVHYEAKKGQHTSHALVEFTGDPMAHDFRSVTELTYMTVPINCKIGNVFGNHWVNVRLGPEASIQVEKKNAWYVDNQEMMPGEISWNGTSYLAVPVINLNKSDISFLCGLEYGYRIGSNGFFLAGNYAWGLRNLVLTGPSGEAYNRSAVFLAGFRRFF
jgi:hypothetical protein